MPKDFNTLTEIFRQMAKRARKHQFHCEKCGMPCEIYRKGKLHRVLVCPACGVLATNPFSFSRALSGGSTGAAAGSLVAGVGAIPGAIGGAVIGGFSGGKEKQEKSEGSSFGQCSHRTSTDAKIKFIR